LLQTRQSVDVGYGSVKLLLMACRRVVVIIPTRRRRLRVWARRVRNMLLLMQ